MANMKRAERSACARLVPDTMLPRGRHVNPFHSHVAVPVHVAAAALQLQGGFSSRRPAFLMHACMKAHVHGDVQRVVRPPAASFVCFHVLFPFPLLRIKLTLCMDLHITCCATPTH